MRLHVLARHGGVWLDATILLAAPLQFLEGVYTPKGPAFTGFYLQGFTLTRCMPVVESWAFAARPGSVFMRLWRDQFMATPNNIAGPLVMTTTYKTAMVTQHRIPMLAQHYLMIHLAAQAVLKNAPRATLSMALEAAEKGPYKYLVDAALSPETFSPLKGALRVMASFHPLRPGVPEYALYKLRKVDRFFLPPCFQYRLLRRAQALVMSTATPEQEPE